MWPWSHFCMFHVQRLKSLLVSAMSSGAICRHHTSSLRLSRLRLGCLPLLLLAFFVAGSATNSCHYPCNPASQCLPLDPNTCQHGVVKDICECCDVCGKGPGDECGPPGKCGEGLVCVQGYEEGLSEQDLRNYPSFCESAPTSTAPTTTEILTTATEDTQSPTAESSTTVVPSPVTNPSSNCNNASTAPVQTEPASGMPDSCREPCSVNFCSDRARICSAAGLEFRKVARRNGCQHTSCNACFLLVRPDCDGYKCSEPPTKRCLREYYECIRDHYFSPHLSSYPVMMKLDDPRAPSWDGEIVCHIPGVEDDVWSAG